MDLVVVEGSQGVSRHGVRSWCGVVGGTWQRFPEIASENEQKLSLRGVEYIDRAQGPTVEVFCQNLRGTHTNPANSLSESYGGRWPSAHVRLKS